MQITREDLNPVTVRLTFSCPPDLVEEGFRRAFKDAAKEVRVPGFRPGQAPRSVLEQVINKEAVKDGALNHILNRAYRIALKEHDLKPYGQPQVEKVDLNDDPPTCEFVLQIPLEPIVNLGDYTALAARQPAIEVTDADVQRQIDLLRESQAKREKVNRAVQPGDIAVVNLKIEGSEDDGRTFMSVVGQTFEALDQALTGMEPEEVKVAELTFPDTFQEADWQGQTLRCKITLRSVSAVKTPDLDEDFAQAMQFESVEELEARVRELLIESRTSMATDYVNEQLMDALIHNSEIHIPLTMVETVARQQLRDLNEHQKQQGRSIEDYATEKGMTVEELEHAVRDEARIQVARALVAQKIFQAEGMKLDNADMNRELFEMARENRVSPDEMVAILKRTDGIADLQNRALYSKVAAFLREKATIEEMSAGTSA